MATAMSKTTTSSSLYKHRSYCFHHNHHQSILPSWFHFSPPYLLHRQSIFLLSTHDRLRRFAVVPEPPSPPSPDPPPNRDNTQLEGLIGTVSKIQDRVKIFLAVLFWMSLFFWVTATDGKGKGKGKKDSRFK